MGAYGQRLDLFDGRQPDLPLRSWVLGSPIDHTVDSHPEVQAVVAELMVRFGVTQVVVSSLIGHGLDVLRTGLPTTVVCHDHHPFCVALYAHFPAEGGECRQCDAGRLARCLSHNPGHRFFPTATAPQWLALRQAFVRTLLATRPTLVAPVPSVRARWQSQMPELLGLDWQVIGHGLDRPACPTAAPPTLPAGGQRWRLVVVGRLSEEKGLALLQALGPALAARVEWTLLGCGEGDVAFTAGAPVHRVPHFQAHELPALLGASRSHVGLVLSQVPETFSFVLSELWACGVPVLASRMGALADRVEHGVNGWLVAPEAEPVRLQLQWLMDSPEGQAAWATVLQNVRAQAVHGLQDMHRQYLNLPSWAEPPGGRWVSVLARQGAAAQGAEATASVGGTNTAWIAGVMYVKPESTWRQAAYAFVRFTVSKLLNSPRLPAGLQAWRLRRLQAQRRDQSKASRG